MHSAEDVQSLERGLLLLNSHTGDLSYVSVSQFFNKPNIHIFMVSLDHIYQKMSTKSRAATAVWTQIGRMEPAPNAAALTTTIKPHLAGDSVRTNSLGIQCAHRILQSHNTHCIAAWLKLIIIDKIGFRPHVCIWRMNIYIFYSSTPPVSSRKVVHTSGFQTFFPTPPNLDISPGCVV